MALKNARVFRAFLLFYKQFIKRWLEAEFVYDRVYLVQRFLFYCPGGGRTFYGADKDIFRGVVKLDKFHYLGLIAAIFKYISSYRIGGEGAKALFDNAVTGKQL